MSDLISREDAIDVLAYFDEKDPLGHTPQQIIMALPSVQPQRWIPCSERLPEEDGQYLVTVRYKHVDGYEDVYAEHGEWCDGNWDMFCFGHCGEVESILAWMPLPEPWEGQDENDRC